MVGPRLASKNRCAEPMFLSEIKKPFIAWCCVAILTLVTCLGQSLHQVAGLERSCACSSHVSQTASVHACQDNLCPFTSSQTDEDESQNKSCEQSPDCCSICRLLSHLGSGFFFLPPTEGNLPAVCEAILWQETQFEEITSVVFAPRFWEDAQCGPETKQ